MAGIIGGQPKPPAPIEPPPPPTIADATTFTKGAGNGAAMGASTMGKTLMTGGQGITSPGNTATKTLLGQ